MFRSIKVTGTDLYGSRLRLITPADAYRGKQKRKHMYEKSTEQNGTLYTQEISGLYDDLYQDIRRARFIGRIVRFSALGLVILFVLSCAIGIPVYLLVQKQKTVDTLQQQNQTIIKHYSTLVTHQKQEIEKFQTLYTEGIVRLEDKIERIENNSAHIFYDARSIISKFKNAVGPMSSEDTTIQELLFLVANHPESLHETIYQALIEKCGIHHYEPKYLFFKHPLAHNDRTIVTSEFGLRTMVKEDFEKNTLARAYDGSYILPEYGGGWKYQQKRNKEFLIKAMYHSAYDLVNDADSTVYARHDGRIIADFENYGTYGRTIFYEYKQGNHVYREQLSHLENGPLTFRRNQRVKAGDVLGYIGDTGNSTGPHLHWAVWKPNPNKPGKWIAIDVYATKLLKDKNIVYIDKMWNKDTQ